MAAAAATNTRHLACHQWHASELTWTLRWVGERQGEPRRAQETTAEPERSMTAGCVTLSAISCIELCHSIRTDSCEPGGETAEQRRVFQSHSTELSFPRRQRSASSDNGGGGEGRGGGRRQTGLHAPGAWVATAAAATVVAPGEARWQARRQSPLACISCRAFYPFQLTAPRRRWRPW